MQEGARQFSGADTAPPERLSKAARRTQLLDCAAQLITQRGIDGVTMEGVAALAGVSKALPYLHFQNAEALIMALREREMDDLSHRVSKAARGIDDFETKIATTVHVGFQFMKEKGTLMIALLWAPDTNPNLRNQPKPRLSKTDWFLAGLFEKELGLKRIDAQLAQRILATGLVGAYEAWLEGIVSERAVERVAVRLIAGGTWA